MFITHIKRLGSASFLGVLLLLFSFLPSFVLATEQIVQVSSLKPPSSVPTINGNVLVYELQITNPSEKTLRIGLIEILDGKGNSLASYSGKTLEENTFVYQGTKRLELKEVVLEKEAGVFLYAWLTLPKEALPPKRLHHKIWVEDRIVKKGEATLQVVDFELPVSQAKPVVLGRPLKGKNWIAGAGPSPDSYHRRTVLPIDGKFYLAQRFAIDWMQVCNNGRAAKGDIRDNTSWIGFGQEVYAVADGVVSKVHDGLPENTPPRLPLPQFPLQDVPGNYVMLEVKQHGKTYFVLFAHMQPGSLKVKEGDKVKAGQLIGLLGNTGNSSAPHLHLHVCDANDPLKSEGVPFVFRDVTLAGVPKGIDMDYGIWQPLSSKQIKRVSGLMPLDNEVLHFTQAKPKGC